MNFGNRAKNRAVALNLGCEAPVSSSHLPLLGVLQLQKIVYKVFLCIN